MKTDKLFYSLFLSESNLINELIPTIPPDCEFSYSAPVIKDTEFRLDGLLTPLSDDPDLPLIFLEAQIQKDERFYSRYFAEIFLYLHQYKSKKPWNGLLILKNRNYDLGSEIPYQTLLNNHIKRLYLEDLLPLTDLTPNLALLKLIVVENSAVTNLGKSILNSAETEQEFQRRFNLIEAILKSKLPQLTTEEILIMFDLKTAKMPELNAYETLVKYWQDKAKEEGLQEGRQEGLQEGRQEGEAELLIRQLNRRCGILSVSLQEKVRSLSIPELESLGEALLDFQNISDLESWFNNQKF
jgi:predicted transposase/invertase (TIGR01784 family)